MRLTAMLAVLVLSAGTAAHAQDCAHAEDQSTMNQCADQAFRRSDATLNTLYRQIQERLKGDADTAKLLTAAQRAWVGFRDAECKFSSSSVAGGSIYPLIDESCTDDLTQQRIKTFRGYLACKEGDMSCPVPAG